MRKEMNILSDKCAISIDVWGDFAMFTPPVSRVERTTYDVPTPSACRGILNAIYSKPIEFYYEITEIEVMKPIRKLVIRKNETKSKCDIRKLSVDDYYIDVNTCHTQRSNTYLRNVYYRIHANIVKRDDAPANVNIKSLESQFNRRINSGKCFYEPALGTRECICYFSKPDMNMVPISESKDLGIMLYDVFDITKNIPLDTRKKTRNDSTYVTMFHANMLHGKIAVPLWDSDLILRRSS